ncbi:hypothetical protein Clst_0379 [Thermoclostridium stercorarium subsp. stercorarium DSM 8532]|uniref:hypothetical protein n=1 Tax=Thermoclostridium stercorarium TaxID=1510 RepID=UPI0002C5AF74|nr:hypothetical protein [Thermoclostridium stercorarium]AGI38480.1 hypothetical protein Clst_0379 [Thermoclostridium stercorarium subsp. stercorarium DSM 8532]
MTKKEWENCNTCWTCKYRIVRPGGSISHREARAYIFCGYGGGMNILTNKDIISSPDCKHREKEEWRGGK